MGEKKEYTSKMKDGLCKNPECYHDRRPGSAYCQACSDQRRAEQISN